MSFSVKELASRIDARIVGDGDLLLTDVASLSTANSTQLSFVESRKQLPAFRASSSGAVLMSSEVAELAGQGRCSLLIVDRPQEAFVRAMLLFRPPRIQENIGISPRAIVASSARIGVGCNVHPGAQVGDGATIGDRCEIGPGCVIGAGCRIGNDTQLRPYVVLYPDMQIGNRVIIHAHAVIGCDGFGYKFHQGQLLKIPHTGTVIIHDDVEIGAGTTIDRGMIEPTVIGQGTKLDNQVQIAHNCNVGKGNAFAAQVGLAGSVTTGDYVQMGGQVGVADHCTIGSQIKLGGQAGTYGNMTEPGVYHGCPAMPEKEAIKLHLTYLKLPELRDQIKKLTLQVAKLEAQLPANSPQRSAA